MTGHRKNGTKVFFIEDAAASFMMGFYREIE
jgi:hypothetical protein